MTVLSPTPRASTRTQLRRGALGLAGLALAAGTVTVLEPGAGAAGRSAGTCVVSVGMHSHITVRSHRVLRPHLHGSAGCTGAAHDYGATATLRGPSGTQPIPLRWSHFGTKEHVEMYASLTRSGTYRIVGGDAQVYDGNEERVHAVWTATSTRIKT